tara:strand:- start:48795 stop:52301 length:3507 start_codon:yes stop_codon:yes gene_type:complete
MKTEPDKQQSNRSFLTLIAGLLLVIVGGTYLYLDRYDRASVMMETQEEIEVQLSRTTSVLNNAIDASVRQTRFLNGTPPVNGIVRAARNHGIDPLDQTPFPVWVERLQKISAAFIENNPEVLQIRYIGLANNGHELLRVSRERGNVRIATEQLLQSKADEAYFQETLKLNEDEVYVSPIDLNREYGRIAFPYVPTYRASTALFDETGAMFGMLVVNFDGHYLLEKVRSRVHDKLSLYVISHEREFILHPESSEQFKLQRGVEAVTTNNFKAVGVVTTQKLKAGDSMGQPLYFLDSRVWLSRPDEGRYLEVIAAIPTADVEATVFQRMFVILVSVGLLVLVVIAIIVFYQWQMARQFIHNITEAKFRAIINGSQDAIVSVDPQLIITSWNGAANRLLHYDEMQAIGKPLLSILELDYDTVLNEATLRSIQDSQQHQSLEIGLAGQAGEKVDLAVSLSPIESTRKGTGITLMFRDISQEKRVAEEIQRLNASLESQVEERTADLEVARNEALQASEMKSVFLANMSHEIRTPMNGIFGMLNLIKRGPLLDDQKRYLTMAEDSVESLSSLINDILDLSKVEAGKLDMESVEFDLLDVLSTQVSSLALKAQQKGLEVLLDLAGVERSCVMGDPHRFKQVITNLMGNAIKFTQRGEILVTARTFMTTEGEVNVTLAVSDTGDGIPQNKAESLFDPFNQVDSSTTRKYGGTGLGLSITKLLVEQMNGTITVESEEGKGSTFLVTVRLPAGDTVPVLEQHKPLIVAKRVLVLGKNLNLLASTRKLLRGWKAHVDTTSSLEEVFARLSRKTLDILIIDQEAFPLVKNQKLKAEVFDTSALTWLKVALLTPQSGDGNNNDLDSLSASSAMKLIKPVSPVEYGLMLERFYGHKNTDEMDGASADELLEQKLDQQLSAFSGSRVLIVDDVMINREVVVGLLLDYNMQIDQAENGLKAISFLEECAVDLVLMDCQMPEMDGFMAANKIREGAAGEHNLQVPIIAMTAGAMAGDRDACMVAGMNDYICKPIDTLEFKKKALHWLQTSGGFKTESPIANAPMLTLDEIDSAPDLDAEAALKRMGDNERIFFKMVDMYIEDTPGKLRSLSTALQEDELETARQLGHALKGTSASIGAEKMQKLCQQIESAAEQQNLEVVKQAVLRLRDEYPNVLRSLEDRGRG